MKNSPRQFMRIQKITQTVVGADLSVFRGFHHILFIL